MLALTIASLDYISGNVLTDLFYNFRLVVSIAKDSLVSN